jgi:hypothetical protein
MCTLILHASALLTFDFTQSWMDQPVGDGSTNQFQNFSAEVDCQ